MQACQNHRSRPLAGRDPRINLARKILSVDQRGPVSHFSRFLPHFRAWIACASSSTFDLYLIGLESENVHAIGCKSTREVSLTCTYVHDMSSRVSGYSIRDGLDESREARDFMSLLNRHAFCAERQRAMGVLGITTELEISNTVEHVG